MSISIAANAQAAATALDASATRLATIMANAQNYSAGQLQAEITKEYAIDNFINSFNSKNKKNIEQIGTIGR
jgi:hypothetical protein